MKKFLTQDDPQAHDRPSDDLSLARSGVQRAPDVVRGDIVEDAYLTGVRIHLDLSGMLAENGIHVSVVDLRSLVPLDTRTLLQEVARTGRLFTVEENPRLCGWGAEISSIVAEEAFSDLDGPIVRVTTPHIPLPSAKELEDEAIPSVERIVETIMKGLG